MINKSILTVLLISLLILGCTAQQQKTQLPRDSQLGPNANATAPMYPIHELKQNNFTSGNFTVEGYVVKIYICPPCPQDAACKPCMRDNIVVSESDNLLDTYTLTEKELIVFTNNTKQFELGAKYRFSVFISDHKSTGESINDVELVGYDLMG